MTLIALVGSFSKLAFHGPTLSTPPSASRRSLHLPPSVPPFWFLLFDGALATGFGSLRRSVFRWTKGPTLASQVSRYSPCFHRSAAYSFFLFCLSTNDFTLASQIRRYGHCLHFSQRALPSLLPFGQCPHDGSSGPARPTLFWLHSVFCFPF